MPARRVIERSTVTGAVVRVDVEDAGDGQFRVIDWRRKPKNATNWQRVKRMIGRVYPEHQLTGSGKEEACPAT